MIKDIELPSSFGKFEGRCREAQRVQFESLRKVVTVCRANNLRYYLSAGTALGAARHKDFIPWDDDIDIVMPRPDYEKLADLIFSDKTELQAYEWKRTPGYRLKGMKVAPKSVGVLDHNIGAMDVFAIDRAPFCSLEHLLILSYKIFLTQVIHSRYGIVKGLKGWLYRTVGFWVPRDVSKIHAMIEDCIRLHGEWNDARRVGYWWSTCGMREFMPFAVFGENGGEDVEFEGEMFRAPSKLDVYLTKQFGDWRKLPPVEERLPHHGDDAPWFYSQMK